ncbi:MAG: helix-turn-helix domain-containing protein [Alphaproteobacteria bacterium]|jgi:CRP/FNR family transcriptional regulator, dissimilatory nitrate respiration regulator|nr:helix-turn-helix domain-containing protein [Alphaproteobacteria bacterium]MBT4084783.1 helix-turn-helix domain-containing protein [Alphaproteobacteria bacterium]MBT4544739.1 helix-turn-helix domain-containing protein [Alphaproteobacteria bacterium]MBT7744131.1 helix-turn-helix domain-containing protein [Alphaproteobacteria bacterium]
MNDTGQILRLGKVTPDILRQVVSVPLFAGLPTDSVTELLANAEVIRAESGTQLFSQGEPADRFYVQLDGQVELFVLTQDNRESVIDILAGGETFAEEAIFDTGIYPVGAKVVSDARLIAVEAQPFMERLSKEFHLVVAMMAGMSRHLRVLLYQISELKLKSTAQRLGGFLLSLTEEVEGEVRVSLPYDKRLLANRLGMKPESLSRALAKLRDTGVTDKDGKVTILDVSELRDYCLEGAPLDS